MKCVQFALEEGIEESPSMRREWIEISIQPITVPPFLASPSMRREWIEMKSSTSIRIASSSPSMRREWIEMSAFQNRTQ